MVIIGVLEGLVTEVTSDHVRYAIRMFVTTLVSRVQKVWKLSTEEV